MAHWRITKMSRDSKVWGKSPRLPQTHYVDSRIYTDEAIFHEEIEKIFNKVWLIACHGSEIPNPYDYRTFQHPCGKSLIVMRGPESKVRCFYNMCSHRGNTILWRPAGNTRRMTCIFHQWQYDHDGNCVSIPREKAGYGDRIGKSDLGLREVKCEMGYGGFAWVNIDDACEPLANFIGDAFTDLEIEMRPELEVFHYHKAILDSNYKLWHDTNRELYHDFMHYHNRVTGLAQKGYFDRVYHTYPNGHVQLDSMEIQYGKYEGYDGQRTLGWPGAPLACHKLIDIFPGTTYILRAPSFRVDTMTPLGANKVAIEFRGLGIKGEDAESRQIRLRDHNALWGPFGLNLHEDMLAIMGQTQAMCGGVEPSYVLHGREENNTTHDEIGMRDYYGEWSRRMGRFASEPFKNVERRGANWGLMG
jgi:methanesulfonate monooxygenase subunit alpha